MKNYRKKPNWAAKGHLNYEFFTFSTVAKSYQEEMPGIVGFSFNYKYENLNAIYDQNNVDAHLKDLLKEPKNIGMQINFLSQQIKKIITESRRLGKKQDLKAFNQWYIFFKKFLPCLGLVLGLEEALEKTLKMFLSDDDFYKIAFARETVTIEEQKSILQLANLQKNKKVFEQKLELHLKRYAWTGNKLMNYVPFTKEQIMDRIKAVGNSSDKKLKEIKLNRKELQQQSSQVKKKLTQGQKHWVDLYQEILFLRTARADAIALSAELTLPLFNAIAKQLDYTREELMRFSMDEIILMFRTKKRINPANRKKYHAVCINGRVKVFWGSWGRKEQKIKNINQITGTIACKGLTKGIAKIIHDLPDLKKVSYGDILVCSYTNPNMILAMEKVGGIVTNIGGLTSHAAIVSRELNKPCIIGTKIATQVLKDGDLVEVDADKGVIKILKRKNGKV